jgi:hypothetical protein
MIESSQNQKIATEQSLASVRLLEKTVSLSKMPFANNGQSIAATK